MFWQQHYLHPDFISMSSGMNNNTSIPTSTNKHRFTEMGTFTEYMFYPFNIIPGLTEEKHVVSQTIVQPLFHHK
jgi:hypothetical protein